mmetsp:Transcript_12024/g.28107  ORF Transcript_12024/g.28107 Transcript_12024/m.28107 type:complete len:122 (+) Transcript_12024:583-948(+)
MGVGRFLNTTESQTDAMYTVHSRDLSGTSKDRNKEENLRALWVSGRLGRTQLVRVHPTTHITFYRIPSHDVTSHHVTSRHIISRNRTGRWIQKVLFLQTRFVVPPYEQTWPSPMTTRGSND